MKKITFLSFLIFGCLTATAQKTFGTGEITIKKVAKNAVRIIYNEKGTKKLPTLPDWLYSKHQIVRIKNKAGKTVFKATRHQLLNGGASMSFCSSKNEYLYGLGQFQDGYSNLKGLSRRLTQVNTQISIPMLLSSKGYGILWNNYGMTEFNPCKESVKLTKQQGEGKQEIVNVTSTEGGKKEVRKRNIFEGELSIKEEGDYSILLDVGQKMARRHNLTIDREPVIEMQNLWLPPTASKIVHLKPGRHHLTAELTQEDKPVVYYKKVDNTSAFACFACSR